MAPVAKDDPGLHAEREIVSVGDEATVELLVGERCDDIDEA